MIICHCNAVSDRDVAAAVEAGAHEADDVVALCGAGGACGGCREAIDDLIARHETPVLIRAAA